jgi:ribonuclease R
MTKGQKPQDPHADREAENYDRPIPSREFILELLEQAEGPMNRSEISAALKLEDDEQFEALRRRLRAMERDGQLLCGRKGAYGLIDKMDLIRGRVQAHRDGFGFLVPDDGSDDLFLNSRQMSTVFDGDEVLSRVSGLDHRGRREGVVIEVLKRNTHTLVGRFFADKGVYFVTPDNTRINHDIFIAAEDTNGAEQEQYVVVEITSPPRWRRPASGKVLEVLGDHMAPGLEIDVAIRSHNIPHEWPEAALEQAATLKGEPTEADKAGRIDVRNLPFVTIDGEDARDFDDAVYCEAQKGGSWKLWVAIADVSHYVGVGSALDKEANTRGNSVYFPERVVPMLPEALSNGLCSLKPDVDRLCMICEMDISRAGKLSGSKFYEGVMHSHARLTYNKVWAILDARQGQHEELRQRYQPLVPQLEELHKLYRALRVTSAGQLILKPLRRALFLAPIARLKTLFQLSATMPIN